MLTLTQVKMTFVFKSMNRSRSLSHIEIHTYNLLIVLVTVLGKLILIYPARVS